MTRRRVMHRQGFTSLPHEKIELLFSLVCGGFLVVGFIVSSVFSVPSIASLFFYLFSYFFGGFFTAAEAVQSLRRGRFEIDFLMLLAALGAAFLGRWAEGALLLFLFSLGHSLEHFALGKARKSIRSIAGLTPRLALLKTKAGLTEVEVSALNEGDTIVVRPYSKIAADGIVISGQGSVNEAPVTGESIPVDKSPLSPLGFSNLFDAVATEHKVFAGTINGEQMLEIRVARKSEDFTIARLVRMVEEARHGKSPTQHFTDRVERYYVPAVLILVTTLLFAFLVKEESFQASFYRAMAVLVASSPCALAISTPSAVLSGIARAARSGILIKGGRPLEEIGALDAVAFDKTGTLTEGKPVLTDVFTHEEVSEEELCRVVVSVESLSDHPLAAALVRDCSARLKQGSEEQADRLQALVGRGVIARYQNEKVLIGNRELFKEYRMMLPGEVEDRVRRWEEIGKTTMIVSCGPRIMGVVALADLPRKNAREILQQLKQNGIRSLLLVTGDNHRVAQAIGEQLGIPQVYGNLMPEDKVRIIEDFQDNGGRIGMVGDGVNDAPAMAKSNVSIAMGAAGSDVALETADMALMADSLENLPFAVRLSQQARRIIRQNLFISLGMVALLIPLTLFDQLTLGPAVIGHEGSTLLVVINALRLLRVKKTT